MEGEGEADGARLGVGVGAALGDGAAEGDAVTAGDCTGDGVIAGGNVGVASGRGGPSRARWTNANEAPITNPASNTAPRIGSSAYFRCGGRERCLERRGLSLMRPRNFVAASVRPRKKAEVPARSEAA